MGARGARRGNTAQQIESQTKDAADALLAAIKLLHRGPNVVLSEEWASYLAAVGRRYEQICNMTNSNAVAALRKGEGK